MCEKQVHKCTAYILCESQREWFTAILLIKLVTHNLKLEINTCNYLMGTSLIYHFLWIKGKPSDIFMRQTEKPLHLPSCSNSKAVNVQSIVITNTNINPTQNAMVIFEINAKSEHVFRFCWNVFSYEYITAHSPKLKQTVLNCIVIICKQTHILIKFRTNGH